MSFYICKCGFPEFDHSFKHTFVKTALVLENSSVFKINALDFSESVKTKCSICTGLEDIHETPALPHKFIPTEIKYRKINFAVPAETICQICKNNTEEHLKFNKTQIENQLLPHYFKITVVIENKGENDEIAIFSSVDDDVKIVWKE